MMVKLVVECVDLGTPIMKVVFGFILAKTMVREIPFHILN